MIIRRHIKQAGYAFGCAFFLVVVSTALIFIIARPRLVPTPTPLPTAAYQAIIVDQVNIIRHDTVVDIVARVRNPNPRAGVPRYPITFLFLGPDGTVVSQEIIETYLLPGGVSYVTGLNLTVPGSLGQLKVEVPPQPSFARLPDTIALPTFSSFLRERSSRLINTRAVEEQKGIIRNTSTLPWQTVEVSGVALDRQGRVVGIGKTFIGELKAGEEREFTLQWPLPTSATDRVIVLPATNIFKEQDILKVIGDPSLLR